MFYKHFSQKHHSSRHTKTTVHTMIIAPHANSCWFRGRQKRTAIPPTASTRVSTIVSHILCLMPFPPRKKISHSINGLNIFMRCILDLFSQPGHIDCQRMLINKIFITVIKSFQKYLSCQDPPRIFHKSFNIRYSFGVRSNVSVPLCAVILSKSIRRYPSSYCP